MTAAPAPALDLFGRPEPRANAELCLLGGKGSPKRRAKNVDQVVISPRREHSRKPNEVSDRIECLLRARGKNHQCL